MRASLAIDRTSLGLFESKCVLTINRVGNGSRKALQEACETIMGESMELVPIDTGTLFHSAFWEISGDYRTGWQARMGYGGNGDPVNPKTGRYASEYSVIVHEDMSANHPIGRAKFLEIPYYTYVTEHHPRTVLKYMKDSLASL